jgi:outer membrane receptor protein involved in Fe transport
VGVPSFTTGVQAGWVPESFPLRVQVGFDASGGYWADDANTVRVPGFSLWSLTVGVREPLHVGGGVALGGYVSLVNLFDRSYVASAFLNPDVVNGVPVAFEPGLPRQLLVSLTITTTGRTAPQP